MTAPTFYTPTSWIDTSSGNTPLSAANLNKIEQGIVNAYVRANQLALTPTVVRTGSFTINYSDFGRFDCSAQSLTSSLPSSQVGSIIGVKKTDATSNTATFNPAAGETIDGISASLILRVPGESRILVGVSGGWVVLSGVNPVGSLDLRYAPVATASPPLFYATQTVTQNFADNTPVAVTFSTEVVDTANGHSTSTNTSRYTCQQAGWYVCSGMVSYNYQNLTGVRAALIYKNGVIIPGASSQIPPGNGLPTRPATPAVLVNLAVNDYVELYAYQNCGTTIISEASATTGSSLTVSFRA